MFQKTFRSILDLKRQLEVTGTNMIVFDKINFLEGFEDNKQFRILDAQTDYITFRDDIRKKTFILQEERPYSCGKFWYSIKEVEESGS